jgi:3-hydroxybutyryl-CoA dehydrogenase
VTTPDVATVATITAVAAIGAGRMGRSIAAAFALAGQDFVLIDLRSRTDEAWQRLQEEVWAELQAIFERLYALGHISERRAQTAAGHIVLVRSSDAAEALATTALLFEAVPETLEAKREAFAQACRHLPADAIIASTSSTMLAGELAALVTHPERFLNAHWLNPAYLIPLVEVSPHEGTADAIMLQTIKTLEAAGKVPVICNDSPGYIVPRLQVLLMNEAARMIEQGIATAEGIDKAIRYGFGIRYASMGVAEFIDFGGVDIVYHASRYMSSRLRDARYDCPDLITEKMHAGQLGVKTGQGLYEWDAERASRFQQESFARMVRVIHLNGTRTPP